MLFALRVPRCLRVLSLSLISFVLVQSQSSFSALNASQSSAESDVRALTEKYGQAIAAGELEALRQLWEPQSPELAPHLNSYRGTFSNTRIEFIIEDAALAYAPSLTVLREMTKRKPPPAEAGSITLLALGNPLLGTEIIKRATLSPRDEKLSPLPEAEQEAKALGQLYGAARSKVYIGAEAREDRVKAEAGQASILHFATHATLNNASPMYSYLVLAPGDKNEDGLLEAWELMELDLKADLAVLSACETARGRFGAGEGMIGLTWAMFVAGVPTTVVSQWKVESASTRDLMLNFHIN